MNASLAAPTLYTQVKKRLFTWGRYLQGPAKAADLIASVVGHETTCRKSGMLKVSVAIHNRGQGHCLDGTPWTVTWHACQTNQLAHTSTVTIPCQVLRGQTETVEVKVPAPDFLGRFQLRQSLPGQAPGSILTPIEVLPRTEDDIDYVAVYKNADLTKNDWHIVGPSTQAEHKKQAGLKLEQLKAAGLTPDSAVFDVGCGTGQLAVSLEPFLSPNGYYFGVDIGTEGIEHCRKQFLRPNFEFDVNGMTTLPPSNRTFDFITLFSVFTHTLADETMLLLQEMKRYLKPTGCVYADVFFSEFVERYAGNRGRIEYERAYWERMLDLVGYRAETANAWQVEPHTRREVFILRVK